ncbi:MAG: M20 family metallopeptidase, partial [Enterocloster clostridioformis]|nr:M20 family metallopeptidase [Enterocloster clostridioformis]
MNIKQRTEELYPQLVQIRRDLHRHPEPGFKEHWTSAHIRGLLDEWGISYQFPVAGTGIVAMIQGGKPGSGNTVALRADMDALPLTEDSSRPCCSLNPGHMHACGHDAHVAIALGTARILMETRSEWSGCVKFFFQPAEETTGGALPMVEAGCMEHPHVDYVTGLHVMPTHETGEIEIRYGDLNASSDEIHIKVHGKSCHGAYPDTGVDAIVMAAAVINSLQTLVSRCISPLDSAVLTLGTIHGGTAGNIVAAETEMTGTLRTTDPAVREKIIDAMTRQVSCTCQAMGG